jgi:hypothetical protein
VNMDNLEQTIMKLRRDLDCERQSHLQDMGRASLTIKDLQEKLALAETTIRAQNAVVPNIIRAAEEAVVETIKDERRSWKKDRLDVDRNTEN